MIDPSKKAFLRVVSALMLICALPMLLWCLGLINNAATDSTFPYAGLGCFLGVLLYAFSIVTAIGGLVFARRPNRYGWCRMLAYVQLAAAVMLLVPLGPYGVLTLPPLFILTILYLFGVGWRNNMTGANNEGRTRHGQEKKQ